MAKRFFVRLHIVVPVSALAHVAFVELPIGLFVCDAIEESLLLLGFGDIQPELHNRDAIASQVPLVICDGLHAVLPQLLAALRMVGNTLRAQVLRVHPDGEHLLVVAAVEHADAAALRQCARRAPEKIVIEFFVRWRLERRHLTAGWIDSGHDCANRSVFAGRVHRLKDEKHSPRVFRVEFSLNRRNVLHIGAKTLGALVVGRSLLRRTGTRLLHAEGAIGWHKKGMLECDIFHAARVAHCLSKACYGSTRMTSTPTIALATGFSLNDLVAIAQGRARLVLPEAARARVAKARAFVDGLAEAGEDAANVYGVNTGFGALAETRVAADQIRALQRNLVRSHACGVGPELSHEVVRAMIALRAQVLALGHSGVRPIVIDLLIALLDKKVTPRIPSQGSVGASGDLAPLAHLALVLIGEGEAYVDGALLPGAEALKKVGLAPLTLEAKEGLALINGTQMMLAIGAVAVVEAESLCDHADVVGAMSLEALQGSARPFDERIHQVRPHPGQATSANRLRALLAGSEIMESHRDCHKVQDPYSLRCMPQVHGATRDALAFARQTLEREILAATDNPLIFVDDKGGADVISGGNFHGQPLAIALDLVAIATAELANVSERRMEQLVNPAMSSGLPPFLAPRTGLDSGFMMAQVTASALVSENKVLCHPASVDSIPSSAGKEDHVSMGSISARKAQSVVDHVRIVLAIEALAAAQGLDLRLPLKPGRGVLKAHQIFRQHVTTLTEDRPLHRDIERATTLLKSNALLAI